MVVRNGQLRGQGDNKLTGQGASAPDDNVNKPALFSNACHVPKLTASSTKVLTPLEQSMISITVQEHALHALIDTGSQISILSLATATKLNINTANLQLLQYTFVTGVEGSFNVSQHRVILGLDFLQKHHTKLDLEKGQLKLYNGGSMINMWRHHHV